MWTGEPLSIRPQEGSICSKCTDEVYKDSLCVFHYGEKEGWLL